MRMFYGQIDKLAPALLKPLAPELASIRDQVAAAPALGWIDGDVNFDTCETMTRVIGREATSDFFRQLWPTVWKESPFMASFVQGILRVHRDPGAYVKYLRVGYPQVFKNFGHWSVEVYEKQHALARLREAPDRCFVDDAAWVHYVAVSLSTLFEAGGHQGQVAIAELHPLENTATLEFTWAV